ncbi:hypothetical protein NE237_029418 [Protea cynaroides]|uniref:Uncharacterized protein n=1 Tax=Protea cynaroides TaxID=273540 RepID=A0A9Q0GT35_9MAGN|nr:hypothetical protein NE237_029418 [Protea cynaroides]
MVTLQMAQETPSFSSIVQAIPSFSRRVKLLSAMSGSIHTLVQEREVGQCSSLLIGEVDCLVIDIEEKLNVVHQLSSKSCIYRVPKQIRKYLRSFVDRRPEEPSLSKYVETMRQIEERTRQCYAETISTSSDEFVKMMLFDGCFILEFLQRKMPFEESNGKDDVSSNPWLSTAITSDFMLLENQLPFFVLEHLYNLQKRDGQISLFDMIYYSFSQMIPSQKQGQLCSFLSCYRSSSSSSAVFKTSQVEHLLHFMWDCYISSSVKTSSRNWRQLKLPHNVTELREAGIKLKVGKGRFLLNISFNKGVLTIPCINVHDNTESLLRNMIAYEQVHCVDTKYITDYAVLLDSFIASSKDVKLLRKKGIIQSLLGEHKQVAQLFNNLGKGVNIDEYDFYFSDVCEELDAYYNFTWNEWKANLRHTYFNTPWAAISVIAAFVLLVFTFLQTLYTMK